MGLNEMLMRQLLSKCLVAFVMAGIFATTAALSWKDTPSQQAEQAKSLYNENKLDEALVSITSAQVGMPDKPELQYNMGNILYKQGNFEDARTGYQVASQDAPRHLALCATYNMGNAAFKAGQIDEAIEAYTNALLIDPSDDEARFNLEIALRARRQSQDQQKQDPQDEDQEKQDEENEEQKSNKDSEQSQQRKDEQKQSQEQGAEQEKGEDEQSEKKRPEQLTKDQMEQILAALRQQEEQVEKELHRAKAGSSSVEKDW